MEDVKKRITIEIEQRDFQRIEEMAAKEFLTPGIFVRQIVFKFLDGRLVEATEKESLACPR